MSWGVVAVGVGTAAAGYMASEDASSRAADAQRQATDSANGIQTSQYGQTRADQAPWRNAGANAIGELQQQMPDLNRSFSMADFRADPGYQFQMDQGNKAIERSAAARGGLNSGATMKSMANYSQGLANQDFQQARNNFTNDQTNRFNRLSSVAGLGQTSANATTAAGTNMANNLSNNVTNMGNATAAQNIQQGNNFNNMLSTGMNTWMQQQMMNRYAPVQPQNPPGTSSPY